MIDRLLKIAGLILLLALCGCESKPYRYCFSDTVEEDGAHPDQTAIADCAGVEDRAMADGYIVADGARFLIRDMTNDGVLKIRAGADDDRCDVAAQDGRRPDTRLVA